MIYYDSDNDVVNFTAEVLNNSYFAVGFGDSMFDTNMIYWLENPDTTEWQELYSTEEGHPPPVTETCFSTPTITTDTDTGMTTF